jgi:hypothetical protein
MNYDFAAHVETIVATMDLGKASALKRGHNPVFPYVPIVLHTNPHCADFAPRQEQILGRAFIEREAAIECARKVIEARREHYRRQFNRRGCRALREQYGLPRELAA